MTPLATTALALLCGLSPVQCHTASTVTIVADQPAPGVPGATASYDPRSRTLYVGQTQDPDILASRLAHELTHVAQTDAGERYTAGTCYAMELEAFTNQASTWAKLHNDDPAFTSPAGWAQVNATDDCRKAFR